MTDRYKGGTGLISGQLPDPTGGRLELPAVPMAVRQARRWAAATLAHARRPPCQELIDTAVLVVSELVTNAIRATALAPGRSQPADQAQFALVVKAEPGTLRIEVHDSAGGQLELPCAWDASAEHGRGLMVVAALSRRWGWRPGPQGKVVWCEIAVE